jgi:hypothetical protein
LSSWTHRARIFTAPEIRAGLPLRYLSTLGAAYETSSDNVHAAELVARVSVVIACTSARVDVVARCQAKGFVSSLSAHFDAHGAADELATDFVRHRLPPPKPRVEQVCVAVSL